MLRAFCVMANKVFFGSFGPEYHDLWSLYLDDVVEYGY